LSSEAVSSEVAPEELLPPRPMAVTIKVIDTFGDLVGNILCWLVMPLMAGLVIEVFSRYLFGRPMVWGYEMTFMIYGGMFMLGAAISWAIGTVLFKRQEWTSPVAALVGWQLLVGAAVITPGALILEPVPDLSELSDRAILALVYLFVLPMVFCQWAYFKVVRLFPAAIAAIGTLAVPVLGVFSSALILGERVGWNEVFALVLICGALASVLVIPALKRRSTLR